ncbi:membrane alanyl aminopeptidase-like [Hyposmocoma kahamanoa]|uniref:membrane alanyl aminopeptidase-like n=1 Tax=Hyposmocoma kahamanoa TaxID=1477025 RepID=UPI000E6D6526|nr:membrane alanyl aminopeptidase-like [Hyposmocoma kahamanoa]
MFLSVLFLTFLANLTNASTLSSWGALRNFPSDEECLNYTVYPVQYDLIIYPHILINAGSYYDCQLTVMVFANAPNIRVIEMDAHDMNVSHASVSFAGTEIATRFEHRGGKLLIYLNQPLEYSVHKYLYQINITYRKYLRTDTEGVFIVPYDHDGTKYLFVTRPSPDRAKYFVPCFDNPRFESVFKIKVIMTNSARYQRANTSLTIASENTKLDDHGNRVIIDYLPSSQIKLHQLGFHYSDYSYISVSSTRTNDTVFIWAPKNKLRAHNFILRYTDKMLKLIHEYANDNRPLVLGPINIVSVPSRLDGYEIGSWNLLTNDEVHLMHVDEFTSIKQKERMTFELVQQLSRIWLGNPGESQPSMWREEWFKEGLATYLAYYFWTQYQQNGQSLQHAVPIRHHGLHMRFKAMQEDSYYSVPALTSFNHTLMIEHGLRYRTLIAHKTASLLWMLEDWIGSDKFHKALVKYVNLRRGKAMSFLGFLEFLDQEAVECMKLLNGTLASTTMSTWFSEAGYPVLNVNVFRDRNPEVIQLKQQRFNFNHNHRFDSHFLIPISYIVQNKQNCINCDEARLLVRSQTYTFEESLTGGWIIFNRNASGYYRVNYDSYTWQLIAKTLKENYRAVDEQNRAQIVDDVFALYMAGDIDLFQAEQILDYLDQETSAIVWDAVLNGYQMLKEKEANRHLDRYLYEYWQKFMEEKVSKTYHRLRNEIEQQASARIFRSKVTELACAILLPECIQDMLADNRGHQLQRKKWDADTRETCFQVLYDKDRNFEKYAFNSFEAEEKVIAERKQRNERLFWNGLPQGTPIAKPYVSSSPVPTICTTCTTITSALEHPTTQPTGYATKTASPVSFATLFVTIVAILIATVR